VAVYISFELITVCKTEISGSLKLRHCKNILFRPEMKTHVNGLGYFSLDVGWKYCLRLSGVPLKRSFSAEIGWESPDYPINVLHYWHYW